MPLVRVHNFSVSLDGFGTGEPQRSRRRSVTPGSSCTSGCSPPLLGGRGRPDRGVDAVFAARQSRSGSARRSWARNKFGPPGWQDDPDWQGWWGEDPPFHTPTFVLTHRPRPPLEMEGGTTFHFLDASPAEALAVAREAAGDLDVRVGGGVTVVRDFVAAGLVDHMHVVVVPIVLGRGVRLWDGLEALEDKLRHRVDVVARGVTHLTFTKRP